MTENVPVRCPACSRSHAFVVAVYPCACGAPVEPPLLRDAPVEPVTHRTWADEWVRVRCTACGRQDHWPRPELGCPCGSVLRIPVREVAARTEIRPGQEPARPAAREDGGGTPTGAGHENAGDEGAGDEGAVGDGAGHEGPADAGRDGSRNRGAAGTGDGGAGRGGAAVGDGGTPGGFPPVNAPGPGPVVPGAPRPAFRPLTIRTARDVVTGAALYLRWLGFRGVVQAPEQPASGIDLRGPEVVAQVDPTTAPASLRAVECLWLHGLNASALGVFFSLAGYEDSARARADALGVPLFVMDLTGAPQPVNAPAEELVAGSA